MEFITNNITTPEGVSKVQFYKVVGMEAVDGTMVDVKVFDGEFTKEEVEANINSVNDKMDAGNLLLSELNAKLAKFTI